MIRIQNLKYAYPGSDTLILDGADLEIRRGDFVAIVGNNGCGKSTLCKTINGLIPHFISGRYEGKVIVDGVDTSDEEIGHLAMKVGYVYQDFENQIVRPTVLDEASYACMNYAFEDYLERGRKALKQCGIDGKENSFIWQLSGGQLHLLALAGAISLEPDVIILDEPVAQLDPYHADLIYKKLKELNQKHNKTVIVVEHHTEYIAEYCNKVVLMKDGKVEWSLPVKDALSKVDELESCNIYPPQITVAAALAAERNEYPDKEMILPSTLEDGVKFFSEYVFNGEKCEMTNKKTTDGEYDIVFENTTVSYRNIHGEKIRIFDDFNLKIKRGEKIALIGSNGAGKSTLMKVITGLVKPSGGNVKVKDMDVRKTRTEALSRYVSMVYQNPEDMFIKESIEKDIAYAMEARKYGSAEKRTEEMLCKFKLTDIRKKDGRMLSGGQMRRASLAIGAALKPQILLLDEPTANLDIATRKEILRTLEDMDDITETVIIATHDMQLVCEWAERVIVLSDGKIIADGSVNEVFGNSEVRDKAGIRPPEIFELGQRLDENAFCYTVDDFIKMFKKK